MERGGRIDSGRRAIGELPLSRLSLAALENQNLRVSGRVTQVFAQKKR
jgi:hypothetical protein